MTNALCKRSWSASLFSRDFLAPARRQEMLEAIAQWRPTLYNPQVKINYHVTGFGRGQAIKANLNLLQALAVLPFKLSLMLLIRLATMLETPEHGVPLCRTLARFFERHYIIFNFISNPLIDIGIVSGFVLAHIFIYSPLARIYYFAPVPWYVYLFAFHGPILLFGFEETKKYYRRKGYPLDFLG
jgi:hypothetical protein